MEKKTYLSPSIITVEVEGEQLLTMSDNTVTNALPEDGNEDMFAKGHSNSIWPPEDEEE